MTEDQTIHLVKGSGPAKGAPPSATNESVGTGVGITQANTATSTLQSTGEGQRGLLGSNPDVNNPFLAATMGGAGTGDAGILRMQQQLMSNPETMVIFSFFLHHDPTCDYLPSRRRTQYSSYLVTQTLRLIL